MTINVPTIILIASELKYDEAIYVINQLNLTEARQAFYFYVGVCGDSYCVLAKILSLQSDISVSLEGFSPMSKGY